MALLKAERMDTKSNDFVLNKMLRCPKQKSLFSSPLEAKAIFRFFGETNWWEL